MTATASNPGRERGNGGRGGEITRVSRFEPGDTWMTVGEVAVLFKFTENQVYKYNQQDLPYHRLWKHCRYLYSEVMNWAMSKDWRIDEHTYVALEVDQLPRCWPPEVWPPLPKLDMEDE